MIEVALLLHDKPHKALFKSESPTSIAASSCASSFINFFLSWDTAPAHDNKTQFEAAKIRVSMWETSVCPTELDYPGSGSAFLSIPSPSRPCLIRQIWSVGPFLPLIVVPNLTYTSLKTGIKQKLIRFSIRISFAEIPAVILFWQTKPWGWGSFGLGVSHILSIITPFTMHVQCSRP